MNDIGYIYKITNDVNGKQYVGQTIDPNKRFQQHKYKAESARKNNENNIALYNAINKYGIEHFHFEIIEECKKELLEIREPYWIKCLNTLVPNGYNILIGGKSLYGENNPFFGKSHTNEAKQKMSEKHKDLYIGENNPMYGKHHTEETKQKIIQKNLDKNMYEYHRQRMQNNRVWEKSQKINPIIAINHKQEKVLLFYTTARAGRYLKELNISLAKRPENIIRKYLKIKGVKSKEAYGFEWIYAHTLINNSFLTKGLSTSGQGIRYLISSKEDKINILFKSYFMQNKDKIIDLSNYYEEIRDRMSVLKILYNNLAQYLNT